MQKAIFELLGSALCWIRSQHLDKYHQFLWIVIVNIQTRHVRDDMGKENTTISLIDWKIIMFDHEGVKTTKVIWSLSILFLHVKPKIDITKKNEVKAHNMHNP